MNMQHPIVVDLDGTLVLSDMLVENFFLLLRYQPWRIPLVLLWLFRGKAYLKQRLADEVLPGVEHLPFNKPLLAWLIEQKLQGRAIVLATASDHRIAKAIASHLSIFDSVMGTTDVNLSGKAKRKALVESYGDQGYDYVGNDMADVDVWKSAKRIYVACPLFGVLKAASAIGKVHAIFDDRPRYLHSLFKAIRMHQWVKNLLIFVPLLASHRFLEGTLVLQGGIAFVGFGACASSVYLLNDLLDLSDDRRHPYKKERPMASGAFPVVHALIWIPALLFLALALSLAFLPSDFLLVLICYYGLTLAYSLWLKRVVMIDVVCLAMLYSMRILAGAASMRLEATFWILAFCLFIFVSLAFVKRYTELLGARAEGKTEKAAGRGYYPSDLEMLASLGSASGYLSVLVLALYINETSTGALYQSPTWMWAACPLLLFWLSRVWLLAHRGEMHDDPIVFAIRDSISRWIGAFFLAVFALAALA